MDIKSIVKEICELSHNKRIEYIIKFLRQNNITHNVYKYQTGINIDVIKKGKIKEKEIIFFAHHDIANKSIEGANDNVSSVAVMLSIVEFLYFFEPYYTIKVVFNDKEELLGALLSSNNSIQKIEKIIENVGSFHYLKSIKERQNILGVFVLELSGIGDSLYFANKSGNVNCDKKLNEYLCHIANEKKINYLDIPILSSDMISINTLGFNGTVIGAIPYIEGKNYLNDIDKHGLSKDIYPHVWKKNHTSMDNYFSIQEKSLDMVYDFVVEIIKNIENIDTQIN